jgi:hypothetical protein
MGSALLASRGSFPSQEAVMLPLTKNQLLTEISMNPRSDLYCSLQSHITI